MDPVTLIVSALATGAAAGANSALQDDVKAEVVKAHRKLRGLLKKRLAGNAGAEAALAEYEAAPDLWEAPLRAMLTEAGAAQDPGLLEAAQSLVGLISLSIQSSSRARDQQVTITDSSGTIIGDNAIQVNHFGS
jgi:hypothetical protein